MKIKYLGHACIQLTLNEKVIIVDPFISGNELAKDISLKDIKCDFILLTHAHEDHVLDTETIAKNNPDATLISNWEIVDYYSKKGIKNTHPMNTGGEWVFDFGEIKSVVAHHSSTFADCSNGGCPNGYVIRCNEKVVYIAGDTALTLDMQLIPTFYGDVDLSILPIGDNFTMGPKDAVEAAKMVNCKKVIPYHYDTFGYIQINKEKASKLFAANDLELNWLAIGEEISL